METHAPSRQSLLFEEELGLMESEKPSSGLAFRRLTDRARCINYSALHQWLASIPWSMSIRHGARFLIPSFLQGPEARQQIRPAQLSPTAYLDGLRGLAALFVFFCHLFFMGFWVGVGWGANGENYFFPKLPFIRLWAEGSGAVAVFFVISGYALSYRPLKLIRAGNHADLLSALSSLTFRRAFRLFLPPIASTFMVFCMVRLGLYELTRDIAKNGDYFHRMTDQHTVRKDTTWEQLDDWIHGILKFANVFSWNSMNDYTSYDIHTWTIPLEFRCSIYLFVSLLGTARLQTKFRFLTVACCIIHCWRSIRWDLLLFFLGMVIAEHDHIRGAHIPNPLQLKGSSRKAQVFWALTSILALYFISMPTYDGATTPGWVWLTTTFVPKWWPDGDEHRVGQGAGAALFVLAIGHVGWWQRFFNSFTIQYLGKISFSLYLMHGPALHGVGYHWINLAFKVTGLEGHWYVIGYCIGAFFNLLTVIWWADVFWRLVDMPSVKFARWIESKVIA